MPPGSEEEARAYYVGVLGFAEVPKPAPLAARGGAWFAAPGVTLHLSVTPAFQPATKAHPALLVQDLGATRALLSGAGHELQPGTPIPGFTRCFTQDPFGNRIELMQRVDPT